MVRNLTLARPLAMPFLPSTVLFLPFGQRATHVTTPTPFSGESVTKDRFLYFRGRLHSKLCVNSLSHIPTSQSVSHRNEDVCSQPKKSVYNPFSELLLSSSSCNLSWEFSAARANELPVSATITSKKSN